jgi:hypothetical protein
MCYEVFNKSAADRYYHEQKRARREGGESIPEPAASTPSNGKPLMPNVPPDIPPDMPEAASPRILRESGPRIDWAAHGHRVLGSAETFFRTHRKVLIQAVCLVLVGFGFLRFTSRDTRLKIFGGRLEYAFPSRSPQDYLVVHRMDIKSWSEIEGRLDTPLPAILQDEIGTFALAAETPQKRVQQVVLHPKEWMVSRAGVVAQSLPTGHASLKPLVTTLEYRGSVQKRDNVTTRLGRAGVFLLPRWPSGSFRPGDTWTEPVEWMDRVGDWAILWRGKLNWKLVRMESREGVPCFKLSYRGDVQPFLKSAPAWAKGHIGKVSFKGTLTGEAYYETRRRRLQSNNVRHQGQLRMAINNVYQIPAEIRVGRSPRKRWGRAAPVVPGDIIIELQTQYGVRKS